MARRRAEEVQGTPLDQENNANGAVLGVPVNKVPGTVIKLASITAVTFAAIAALGAASKYLNGQYPAEQVLSGFATDVALGAARGALYGAVTAVMLNRDNQPPHRGRNL